MASWPPLLRADASAAMLNFEIADHPVYHGLELQWFDDAAHGTGMLAFLGHRDSHVFDYYAQRGLRLDPADYQRSGHRRLGRDGHHGRAPRDLRRRRPCRRPLH